MIIQSIHNAWDTIYNQYRNTVYKTLEDPVTQKQYIEIVQYLYNKEGRVEESTKGRNVDKQA
jgi:DNA-binding NtrC family response regulator